MCPFRCRAWGCVRRRPSFVEFLLLPREVGTALQTGKLQLSRKTELPGASAGRWQRLLFRLQVLSQRLAYMLPLARQGPLKDRVLHAMQVPF